MFDENLDECSSSPWYLPEEIKIVIRELTIEQQMTLMTWISKYIKSRYVIKRNKFEEVQQEPDLRNTYLNTLKKLYTKLPSKQRIALVDWLPKMITGKNCIAPQDLEEYIQNIIKYLNDKQKEELMSYINEEEKINVR